jgi:hypothetical protein
MRVISQNKAINIPYEGTIFYVVGPYIYAQRNEFNHSIGKYKCSKDAISVMTDMLVAGADPFNNFYFQLDPIDEESC